MANKNKTYNEAVDNLINLLLYSPEKSRIEYINDYKRLSSGRFGKEGSYRYSPIYLLRKDIRFCLAIGSMFNDIRPGVLNENPNFAAVLLMNIAVSNIVKKYFNEDFKLFAKTYLNISSERYIIVLRYLRNGLEHNGYSIHYRIRARDIKDKKDKYHEKGDKIYFTLDSTFPKVISKKSDWKKEKSSMYYVNIRKLQARLEDGLDLLRRDLLDHKNLKQRTIFKKNTDKDNWLLIK